MPYYAKSEDWLHQSSLLLQARPLTTRITTRYHLKPARRVPKPKKSTDADATTTTTPPAAPKNQQQQQQAETDAKPPRGHLVLKTYDAHSGVTLKYKTSKAAEVTRLVQMLGTLGRGMAGLAATTTAAVENVAGAGAGAGGEDEVMVDVSGVSGGGEVGSGAQTPVGGATAGGKEQQQQQQGGGGGGKKKKKGKK